MIEDNETLEELGQHLTEQTINRVMIAECEFPGQEAEAARQQI